LSRVFINLEGLQNISEDFVMNFTALIVLGIVAVTGIPTLVFEAYSDSRTRRDGE
jgi:hypothetical protein